METDEQVDDSVFDTGLDDGAAGAGIDDGQGNEGEGRTNPDEGEGHQKQQQASPDPNAIAEAVARGMAQHQASQPQQQQPLTEEQIKEKLHEFSYNEDYADALIQELKAEEPDKTAIVALLNSSHASQMKQAQTYAYYMTQMVQQEMMRQFGPAVQFAQQQQQEMAQERFFKSYEQLRPFKALLPLISKQLQESGKQFGNEQESFEALAREAEKHIQSANPEFKLAAARKSRAKKNGATQPNVTSFGGQGGASQGAGAKSSGGSADIWD